MSIIQVSVSGQISAAQINAGDSLVVRGGTATDTTVLSGGMLDVQFGGKNIPGSAVNTIVSAGGSAVIGSLSTEIVTTTDSGVTIASGGTLQVNNGGIAVSDIVQSGGNATIKSGGLASNTQLSNGAILNVNSGGKVDATLIDGSAVFNGGQGLNDVVQSGGSLTISNGGRGTSTVIHEGAYVNVTVSGQLLNPVVDPNVASAYIGQGGIALVSGLTVPALQIVGGGIENVLSGGVIVGQNARTGGIINISGGGAASATTIDNEGTLNVLLGGQTSALSVNAGGTLTVSNGGVSVDDTITSAGTANVLAGGSASGMHVANGGILNAGGSITQTDIEGKVFLSGGTALNDTIHAGGSMTLSSGGIATSTHVENGGYLNVVRNATVVNPVIDAGTTNAFIGQDGHAIVSNATVQDLKVLSAGVENVLSGGIALNQTIADNATINVSAGGQIQGGFVSGYYAFANILSGGVASGVNISGRNNASGALVVSQGGVAQATIINNGGYQSVSAGGVVSNTIVNNGGNNYVFAGGIASNTVVSSGGMTTINSGGIDYNTTIAANGSGVVNNGAVMSNVHVLSGGTETVNNGGIVRDISVDNGGSAVIANGGTLLVTSATQLANVSLQAGAQVGALQSGGVISNLTIGTSNTLMVQNGGSVLGATVSGNHAIININNGGYGSGNILSGGDSNNAGVQNTYAGGVASNTIVGAYGIEVVLGGQSVSSFVGNHGELDINGGVATSALIQSGGSANIRTGGTGSSLIVNSGGYINVSSGGTVANARINPGGKVIVYAGGSGVAANGVTSNVTLSGGNMYVLSGGIATNTNVISGAVIVSSGGKAVASGTSLDNVTVMSGGKLVVDGSNATGNLTSVTNANLASGSVIEFPELTGSNYVTNVLGNVITVTDTSTGNTVASVTLTDSRFSGQILYPDKSTGDYEITVCFLSGTLISTPHGDKAIETLSSGDEVFVWENGLKHVEKLTWTGKKHQRVNPLLPDDEAGFPVRVVKNAIADGMPSQDLFITSEHCLFIHNRFIPVRMLVNGSSIYYDREITEYEYHHIETGDHSVIMANGALTESYLDTGNRGGFKSSDSLIYIGQKKSWHIDAAAPLCTDRATVEPIYNKLVARLEKLNLKKQENTQERVYDSDLHLVTNSGRHIRPLRRQKDTYVFIVPAQEEKVYLASRASRPSDAIGPYLDDRRQLGVLVGEVALFCDSSKKAVTLHLSENELLGWHKAEEQQVGRWTNGYALLPLSYDRRKVKGPCILSVQVLSEGPYLLRNEAGTVSDYCASA